jgi:hypothetical protein
LKASVTGHPSKKRHLLAGVVLSFLALGATSGCKKFQRKHIPVESVAELGYPTCEGASGEGRLIAESHIRSGPNHPDPSIVERFSIRDRGCLTAFTVRQEWPMGTADVEVLYDDKGLPLRIWKRMTLPSLPNAAKRADIRRYELRTDPVSVKQRTEGGEIKLEHLLGGKPTVVIGPGRGLISMWIRRTNLKVGEKVREVAIDVRGLEKIEPVTLLREKDMHDPKLGGHVRAYTFYGRETVFTNDEGIVVGDLAGLRADRILTTKAPDPLPLHGPLDPVGTP